MFVSVGSIYFRITSYLKEASFLGISALCLLNAAVKSYDVSKIIVQQLSYATSKWPVLLSKVLFPAE